MPYQNLTVRVPEFPPVEEPTCDPYSPAYTDAVFQALDLDGPEYSAVDADTMKGFKELICQYPTAFLLPWESTQSCQRV